MEVVTEWELRFGVLHYAVTQDQSSTPLVFTSKQGKYQHLPYPSQKPDIVFAGIRHIYSFIQQILTIL